MYKYKIEAVSETRELTATKEVDAGQGKYLSKGDWIEVSSELPRFYFQSKILHFPYMTFVFGTAPLSEDGLDSIAKALRRAGRAGWDVEISEAT